MDKVLYGAIPPPKSWPSEKVAVWTEELSTMLEREGVFSINLPEVINETREDVRVMPFVEKMDNLIFASLIKKKHPRFHSIPNKITVQLPKQDFIAWLQRAEEEGIQDIILVGGEQRSKSYPGLSVLDAAILIRNEFPKMHLGGITIFTRKGEAQRIIDKMQCGIQFFVSQIIFETANVKCVLLDLEKLCRRAGLKMPRIYLSFAPAGSKVDLEFMQWLGVEFPTAVWSYFMDHEESELTERVFEVLNFNLNEIGHFLSETNMDLGFNIEQIMYKSRESGERLLKLVKKRVERCQ